MNLNDEEQKILEFVRINPKCSLKDISVFSGYSKNACGRKMKELVLDKRVMGFMLNRQKVFINV